VRQALLRFDEQVRPADRLIVMKPLDSQLAIDVTPIARSEAAIETFEGRDGDFAPRTEFEAPILAARQAVEAACAQM
jgi:hypothetical protein